MTEKLTCEKMKKIDDGVDAQNRPQFHHERCSKPASEVVIPGMLTSAKAILCGRHASAAKRQSWVSKRGFAKGKIAKPDVIQEQIEPALKF